MVRPRQVGSDLPSGVRRPSRAVSLFDFDEFDRMISEGTSEAERTPWDLVEDPATGELVERSELGRGSGGRVERLLDEDLEEFQPRIRQGAQLVREGRYDEALDVAREIADDHNANADERYANWGYVVNVTPEAVLYDMEIQAQHEEEDLAEAEVLDEMAQEGAAGAEMRGLTADEAFRLHHAMAGGEPPREGRAHPERVPAPYEPVPPMSEKQKKLNRENIEKIRRGNPISQMAGPDWEAIEEGDYGAGNWWDTVPGMDDLGEALPDFDEEDLNPELRSMDSQMLADMMVAQPEQGYFGGLGDAVQGLTNRVAGMSGQERAALIAALVAAGLITVGSGGTLAPAGAALLGGAGLTALNQ